MRRAIPPLIVVLLVVLIGAFVVNAADPGSRYDSDRSGYIESSEVLSAFDDYFDGGDDAGTRPIEVWMRYAAQIPVATPSPDTLVPTPTPTPTPTPEPTATPTPIPAPSFEMLNCRKYEHGVVQWNLIVCSLPARHEWRVQVHRRDIHQSFPPRRADVGVWVHGSQTQQLRRHRGHRGRRVGIAHVQRLWQFTPRLIHDSRQGYLDEIGAPFNTSEGERNQLTYARGFFVNGHRVLSDGSPGLQTYISSSSGQQHYENPVYGLRRGRLAGGGLRWSVLRRWLGRPSPGGNHDDPNSHSRHERADGCSPGLSWVRRRRRVTSPYGNVVSLHQAPFLPGGLTAIAAILILGMRLGRAIEMASHARHCVTRAR